MSHKSYKLATCSTTGTRP